MTTQPYPETVTDACWMDRLVELHVLAEHGDTASAAAADRWMATDVHAREVWTTIERLRDQLRAAANAGNQPATDSSGLNTASS